jgi:hypothetical protein
MRRLLVTVNVPSLPILVTLMKDELSSSEPSILTRAIRRNIPEDVILHRHLEFRKIEKVKRFGDSERGFD